jgi:hypothetical protein
MTAPIALITLGIRIVAHVTLSCHISVSQEFLAAQTVLLFYNLFIGVALALQF